MKKSVSVILSFCFILIAGCHDDPDCHPDLDYPRCGDNNTLIVCDGEKWLSQTCDEGETCVYTESGAFCHAGLIPSNGCEGAGVRTCVSPSIVQVCMNDGTPRYETCTQTTECQNGWCLPNGVVPSTPLEGLLMRRCSNDGKRIETVHSDGNVETRTCVEEVGFDTHCETYGQGHVGCALPSSCNEIFSLEGTCVGNVLLSCDTSYIRPLPTTRQCEVCAEFRGVKSCFDACDLPDAVLSCGIDASGQENVHRCVKADSGQNIIEEGLSLCKDSSTSVTCSDGQIIETTCPAGNICLESTGLCVQTCLADNLDKVSCSSNGDMMQCQQVGSDFVMVSLGKRHCLDDVLVTCLEETGGGYSVKETNCREYVHTTGEVIECSCELDYQYPDMDVCVPVTQGNPCNGITENGICQGNQLTYCVEEDDALVTYDCGVSMDGFTSCSVYSGFADCRMPCTTAGNATCSVSAYGGYQINLCTPDDGDGHLALIEGDSVCLGNLLYLCNDEGNPVIQDCTANGGRCDVNSCVYPACSTEDAPICLADDVILSCQMATGGLMTGTTMQTLSCDPQGHCRKCENGRVVDEL